MIGAYQMIIENYQICWVYKEGQPDTKILAYRTFIRSPRPGLTLESMGYWGGWRPIASISATAEEFQSLEKTGVDRNSNDGQGLN